MNIVKVDETNYKDEYKASTEAIRDFLYMYFDISLDCLPTGDFDRAELGNVDPFRFLDIEYIYKYQFRNKAELNFLHQGAAINLLCRLAQVYDLDGYSGSTFISNFLNEQTRIDKEEFLKEHVPELFKIHDAYCQGKIVKTPSIIDAFRAAFHDSERFYTSLERVLTDVIFSTFESLYT